MTSFAPAPGKRRPIQLGFTLIEVLVVLVIVGIATTTVGLSIGADPSRGLRQDARRLANLFMIAQNEVHIDGRVIAWQADESGYRFVRGVWVDGATVPQVSTLAGLDDFSRNDALRPRQWQSGNVRVLPAGPVVLNDEWFQAPWELTLVEGQSRVVLRRGPTGQFQVE
ncbi:general secretion pathway protein H [Bordetella ansorpii]|jgi:general secretion pathway protein H|uniref:General secretion pathway protein H n=1 Tax=Bordetella ansorpii TaxID=288768 RepID=A0A157QJY6_9BORD|nr:prepilin-type N-terminal cleavage/methylation domain-containing protein [Bordetella ansorpii]SAI46212.1 general secretion pathway protein H [Bordetella ansorpii]